jgi:hypothetical protein
MVPASTSDADQPIVALLCPQPRLRRILRLALLADDQRVVEWSLDDPTPAASGAAVVADLDSLGLDVVELHEALRGRGIAEGVALLLISVYPLEPAGLDWAGPTNTLQPPFSPQVLAERVRRLLDRVPRSAP